MQTIARTLTDLLSQPQKLVVPMFQRAYAWDREPQWEPLWDDVLHLLDLAEQGSTERHFLGAIVLQRAEIQPGGLQVWDVIDGQQRLTTLQILLDAVAGVVQIDVPGGEMLASRLTSMTENLEAFRATASDRFKLSPTTRDLAAFEEVMAAPAPVDHGRLANHGHRLARAHTFFTEASRSLVGVGDDRQRSIAASNLVETLLTRIELVVISLEQTQAIFETLNARMTPLQPTDLIKNLVFQRAAAEGVDAGRMYETMWRRFEQPFWEKEVRQGQLSRPRFTVFTNYWVSAMLGQLVTAADVFRAFKRVVQTRSTPIADLMAEFVDVADRYRELVEAADGNGPIDGRELTVYRLQASDVGTMWPLFIYLMSLERGTTDERLSSSIDRVFEMVESWVVRKVLLGQSLTPAPRFAVELVQQIAAGEGTPAEVVEDYLTTATGLGVWPDDAMLMQELPTMLAYKRLKRSRLRMVLEALEDEARGFVDGHARTAHARMTRHSSQIEHIMPAAWQMNWPIGDRLDVERDRLVHTFGNLALLPQRFNASVSNLGWGERDGEGKREAFHRNSADLLLRDVLEQDEWNEAAIERRTKRMVDGILRTWPVPEGHEIAPETVTAAGRGNDVVFLLEQGRLRPGDELRGAGRWTERRAVVRADGRLDIGGHAYESPTAAAKAARGDNRSISGPWFWRLGTDGPSLMEMRVALVGWEGVAEARSDTRVARQWAVLHRLMDALPPGRWTSYGDLAAVIGTHANPLGQHIAANAVPNAWRVLQASGKVSPGFEWRSDRPSGSQDPLDILREEGVPIHGDRAAQSHRLGPDELRERLGDTDMDLLEPGAGSSATHTPASLADEVGVHPRKVREMLREHPTAVRPGSGAEWVIDEELAGWVRDRFLNRSL